MRINMDYIGVFSIERYLDAQKENNSAIVLKVV